MTGETPESMLAAVAFMCP
jgi:hypothetical protein